jgi:hypothetical protein
MGVERFYLPVLALLLFLAVAVPSTVPQQVAQVPQLQSAELTTRFWRLQLTAH